MNLRINQLQDTRNAASKIAAVLRVGDVIALKGEMGAGKTTFVKELVRALQSADHASSPTFAIAQRYEGAQPVWHLDLYRLEDPEELEDIGYEEYFYPEDAITVIEWPQIARDYLPRTAHAFEIIVNGEDRTLQIDDELARRLEETK